MFDSNCYKTDSFIALISLPLVPIAIGTKGSESEDSTKK